MGSIFLFRNQVLLFRDLHLNTRVIANPCRNYPKIQSLALFFSNKSRPVGSDGGSEGEKQEVCNSYSYSNFLQCVIHIDRADCLLWWRRPTGFKVQYHTDKKTVYNTGY